MKSSKVQVWVIYGVWVNISQPDTNFAYKPLEDIFEPFVEEKQCVFPTIKYNN